MAGTRSSARLNQNGSPPAESNKRKAEDGPEGNDAKKGKKAGDQKTLEETLQTDDHEVSSAEVPNKSNGSNDGDDGQDAAKPSNGNSGITAGDAFKGQNKDGESNQDPEKALKNTRDGKGLNRLEEGEKPRESPKDVPLDDVHGHHDHAPAGREIGGESNGDAERTTHAESNGDAIESEKAREEAMPSNMLEKGIIYFFTRGRVGIENIESVQDLQRSFFVLRPIPDGAKIGDGVIGDEKNARLIALPKKVWPKSGKDRFMAFVESAKVSIKDLKEDFLQGSEYETKTVGTRQTPPVTPIGEGVYAITSTGNRGESHLAYLLTIPQEPGNMQEDIGIKSQGSFIISLKNPEVKGPANASLPQKPDYPKE